MVFGTPTVEIFIIGGAIFNSWIVAYGRPTLIVVIRKMMIRI